MNQTKEMVFVFGSNLAGVHGAGAARHAHQNLDAVWGKGIGFGSRGETYALPTKDHHIKSLHREEVRKHVEFFLRNARFHHELTFKVTQIGCGLAGFTGSDIAPMFIDAPENCYFDEAWKPWLGEDKKYWGTA